MRRLDKNRTELVCAEDLEREKIEKDSLVLSVVMGLPDSFLPVPVFSLYILFFCEGGNKCGGDGLVQGPRTKS